MVTLYNVISADGFIASKNGAEDFIPDELWDVFLKTMDDYDVLVFGRKTYEAVQHYAPDAITALEQTPIKKLVVSSDADFTPTSRYTKIAAPQDALAFGNTILVCSGPTLNNAFLSAQLVDKVILVMLPIAIHDGIPAFITEPALHNTVERPLANGAVWRKYSVSH